MKDSSLVLALFLLIPCSQAAGRPLEKPDFTLDVQLDERASRYLAERRETVGVSISFADSIGPGEVSLAHLRHEAKTSFAMHVKDVQFDLQRADKLRTKDYEVLVNVFSNRRALDGNVLDCDVLQAPISQLQKRVHKIRCRLGTWAPR